MTLYIDPKSLHFFELEAQPRKLIISIVHQNK